MLLQRIPFPERLYTQNDFVGVGTRENTVSNFTESTENVNSLDGESLNESPSEQAASNKTTNKTTDLHNNLIV